ncbi:MAG: hypothetical protein WBF39_05525 [Planococcus donghaensis]
MMKLKIFWKTVSANVDLVMSMGLIILQSSRLFICTRWTQFIGSCITETLNLRDHYQMAEYTLEEKMALP